MIRIVGWNIRAGGGKRVEGIFDQLVRWRPDVVVLSEFRGTPASQLLAQWLKTIGLNHQQMCINEAKLATNGLLVASRFPLEAVVLQDAPKAPYRWLLVEVKGKRLPPFRGGEPFTLGGMHIPNSVTGKKKPYHEAVAKLAQQWTLGPGILIGDTNSGMPHIDEESRAFGKQEQQWLESLAAAGWADLFRHHHGDKRAYTWYSPNKGNGFRLDQAFANPQLLPDVVDCWYEWGQMGDDNGRYRRDILSDHAAIIVELTGF